MDPNNNLNSGPGELPPLLESVDGSVNDANLVNSPESLNKLSTSQGATNLQFDQSTPHSVISNIPTPLNNPGINSNNSSQSMIADDTDLIEKEWVIKAKAIVYQTKDDPHKQNQEVVKIKGEYLKKRFNKDLKSSESH